MDRARARALAQDAIARGKALSWFEALYREADGGTAVVPWADLVPNPQLVAWLDANPSIGGRALDVGTGFGDNAEELARRGMDVVAFDVAATAVARARARFPGSPVRYLVADLLDPPADWRAAFDLVAETYTLQVLPPSERGAAVHALRTFVAPGGTLLVIARGREPAEPEGVMPWPLTRPISRPRRPRLAAQGPPAASPGAVTSTKPRAKTSTDHESQCHGDARGARPGRSAGVGEHRNPARGRSAHAVRSHRVRRPRRDACSGCAPGARGRAAGAGLRSSRQHAAAGETSDARDSRGRHRDSSQVSAPSPGAKATGAARGGGVARLDRHRIALRVHSDR